MRGDEDEIVSRGSGTMSGETSSNASSRAGASTRSGRVPISSVISGGQPISQKKKTKALCGLDKCGSTSEWAMPQSAACVDCGAAHTGNEFLCAACHRTGDDNKRWKHLGPSLYAQAVEWFEQCRAAGEGLPTCVVESFVPSTSCLCSRSDCFFANFAKHRSKITRNMCVPCGSTTSSQWRNGGGRAEQYQLFFEGAGRNRADGGMLKTKQVLTAESTICNPCHMAFHNYVTSPGRHPTARELLAAPVGPQLPQGIERVKNAVKRHVYEALAAGKVVCSKDIETKLVAERRANNIEDASAGHIRRCALKILQDVGEGVGDVSVREYRGGAFGEDSRVILVYLIPTSDREDIIAGFDRKVRKMDRENEDLRQQLREARRATPTASSERDNTLTHIG